MLTFTAMPAVQLKDHYKVLGVPPQATTSEIKTAFRKMAHQYHPDKAPGNIHAEHFFREVQEAYNVLSDPHRKKIYDNERWLAGMVVRAKEQEAATAEWILKESIKLNQHMHTVDAWRMSHQALYDYVMQLLDNNNMAVLLQEEHASVRESVVEQVLSATKILKYQYMQPLAQRLSVLANGDNNALAVIATTERRRKRQADWDKTMPFFVIGITLLLVALMFFWGDSK